MSNVDNHTFIRQLLQRYKYSCIRGYSIETILCLLSFLMSKNKNIKNASGSKFTIENLLPIFISKNHFVIANSFGLASITYQILLQKIFAINKHNTNNKNNNDNNIIIKHIISSFISSFWLYYINISYRKKISTYLFMRSLYDLYKYIQNEPQFDKYPLLTFPKKIKYAEFYIFMLLSGAIGYGLYHDPQLSLYIIYII